MRSRSVIGCIAVCFMLILSGCGERIVNGCADEIRSGCWECRGDIAASLVFDGDRAVLTVSSPEEKAVISGLCLIDDGTLTICDESDEYVFGYTLRGKTLNLENDCGSADFVRESY